MNDWPNPTKDLIYAIQKYKIKKNEKKTIQGNITISCDIIEFISLYVHRTEREREKCHKETETTTIPISI